MAGVEWGGNSKWTKGALKSSGFKRHFDLLIREMTTHSNPDIDVSLTHGDCYLDPLGRKVNDPHYWKQIRNNILDEVSKVDEKYPPLRVKADRKIAQGLTIYIPLDVKDPLAYAQNCVTLMTKLGHHIAGAELHVDEQHWYTDRKTKEQRLSMHHLHVFEVPYAEWTEKKKDGTKVERKGINMKHYATIHKIKELNVALDEMSLKLYGVSMMTGEGTSKTRLSIEDAKVESKKAELEKLEQEIKIKSGELTVITNASASLSAKKKKLDEREADLTIREADVEKREAIQEQQRVNIEKDLLKVAQDRASLTIEKETYEKNQKTIDKSMDDLAIEATECIDKAFGSAISMMQNISSSNKQDLVGIGASKVAQVAEILRKVLLAFLEELLMRHREAREKLRHIPRDQGDVTPRVQEILKENKLSMMDDKAVYKAAVRIYNNKFSEKLEDAGLDLPYVKERAAEDFAKTFVAERQKNPRLSFGDLYKQAAENIIQKYYDEFGEIQRKALMDEEIAENNHYLNMRNLDDLAVKAMDEMDDLPPTETDRFEAVYTAFKRYCEDNHIEDPMKLMKDVLELKHTPEVQDIINLKTFSIPQLTLKLKDISKEPKMEIEHHVHMSF